MPKTPGVVWEIDTLRPTLAQFTVRANVAIAASSNELAKAIEEWMRENAPWDDRTGDAREGLSTDVLHEGFRQEIYLMHGVDYGIWLEVRWNGRYAIIQPALDEFGNNRAAWPFFAGVMPAAAGKGGMRKA